MRLKSLKLAGFKSFANSTTFTFSRGITAIVGPNGCGKSNVIDAIRWVLGETSAKQLRGGAMSDVIFAGTQEKSAKSVASVELTFEHTQDETTGIRHEFNLYQELSVRRQINMEGRSDYFINGTRCRRRDVIDVFLGTGLGARSYAVIEQGMIGRIVDSNPMQLREFIEEAAGVSRYQARRDETQKKLETTQENLARLHDMQSELLRQQKTLSKQAASAERYQELTKSLADTQQQLAIQQLYQAKEAQLQQKQHHERSSQQVTDQQKDYDALKAKQDKLSAQINQEQWLKDDAQNAHYQQQLKYQQAEQQLNELKSQRTQVEQQLASLEVQRQHSAQEIEQLKTEQAQQQTELETLRPQFDELTGKREAYKQDEQPLQRLWHEAQAKLAQLQESVRALEQQQALNAQSKQRHQQSLDKWRRRQHNWQTLWDQLQHSFAHLIKDGSNEPSVNLADLDQKADAKIAELNNKLQQIIRQQHSVDERLSEFQPQAQSLQQHLIDKRRELAEFEKRHAMLSGEYDTLDQILNPKLIDKAQRPSSIKNSLEDNSVHNLNKLPISTLREQIELSTKGQEHAQVLDSVLALWLDSHVLVTDQVEKNASQSADNLWQALEGYLPNLLAYQAHHNDKQNGQDNTEARHSLWLPANLDDSLDASLDSRLDSNQPTKVLEHLPNELVDKLFPLSKLIMRPALALWQQCYLYLSVDKAHLNNAQELDTILKALPASALLLIRDSLTHEVWIISRQGMINLNKFAGAQAGESDSYFLTQRLQQRTRIEQLEALLDDSDKQIQRQQQIIKTSQYDYDTVLVNLEEIRAQNEQLTQDKHHYEQQLNQQKVANERLQTDIKRLNNDKSDIEQDQQELLAEQQTLEREQQRIQEAMDKLLPKLASAKDERQQLQTQRSELIHGRQINDNNWQALQLNLQKSELRLEHSVTSLASAIKSYEQLAQNKTALITQLERLAPQLPNLQTALLQVQSARDEQQALLIERKTVLTELKRDYNQQQIELDNLQTALQTLQREQAKQATELALSEARLADASTKAQDALEHYDQINHKDTAHRGQLPQQSVSVSSLLTDFIVHERRVRPDKIAELASQSSQIEQQLSKIGAVNLAAAEELRAINERLEPLTQQTEDIAASMQTLSAAITSIDETTKTLFMQTLDAVNGELAKLFAKVFGGGQASLTLNLEDMPNDIAASNQKSEQWRAGLTLMAQPKGKRNSRLAVLSGGEKTLTALSLIFAIFKQHPAPFCVLDEVDAPLDDANVARFTSLISDLAGDLQFIFISHNKLSMQIADELKGVTMPSAGISTLVSVSLDDAAHYIDA